MNLKPGMGSGHYKIDVRHDGMSMPIFDLGAPYWEIGDSQHRTYSTASSMCMVKMRDAIKARFDFNAA
jgi:hypothetical protein